MLIVNFLLSTTAALLIFKALVSFAKVIEPPLHCMFISSSWAKGTIDAVSCLCALQPILNLNKKITQICFLSNILSLV